MRNVFLITMLSLAAISLITAQSADRIDQIMGSSSLSLKDTAWIMLGAAGDLPAETSPSRAYYQLQQILPYYNSHPGSATAAVRDVSYMGIAAFQVPGSLFLTLFRHPRYAYRVARYRRIFQASNNPGDPLSGLEVLQLATRFSEYVERGRPSRL